MICKKESEVRENRHSERGNAGLVAMIFIAFATLTVLTLMASNSFRESRNLDKSRSKLHEKMQALSGVNTLAQIVAKDAPKQMNDDVRQARRECNLEISMPIFDNDDVRGESVPAVVFRGTEMTCAGSSLAASPTSIFGLFANWRDARVPMFEATGREQFSLNAENIRIVQLDEIYRRSLTDSDVAYAVRYIVEAKFGNYRTRTNGEMILGTNIPTCGTSATLEVTPATVERGNPVDMQITYAYANRLQIYNSAGTLLHEENVAEQTTPQTYVYRFTPASTDTYRVVASGSGGCQARSANVVITVTDPPALCPRLIDFSASSLEINSGESVTLSWNVQDAAVVTFEGANVAAVGSQSFTLTATRTFTLTARDTANTCPISRQITVVVRPTPPSCSFTTPQIQTFSANPTSIAVGESSTLTWNINNVASSGTVRITGASGLNQTVNVSGNLVVNPPSAPGDYTYTITAENTCPDGTVLRAQATVVISVRTCPPPDITAFTVNPSTVTQGGNQMIRFAWNVGGTADAVSINNGVGGGLPTSGTVEVPQPQSTTTYTLTAVGCGQTRQAQVTVTVNSCPIPVISSFTASPASVLLNGNQNVVFNWNVSGTVDSQTIDQGIGSVSGNSHTILQPQATTDYTYTVTGCGSTVQSSTTVSVQVVPGFCPNGNGNAISYYQVRGYGGAGNISGEVVIIAQSLYKRDQQAMEIRVLIENFLYGPNSSNGQYIIEFGKIQLLYITGGVSEGYTANLRNTVTGETYTRPLTHSSVPVGGGYSKPVLNGVFDVPYQIPLLATDRLTIGRLYGANAVSYGSTTGWNGNSFNININGGSSIFSCQ